jgi:hypothetical protein
MNRFWTEKPTAVVYFLPPRKWRMSARYISSADYTNFWRKKRGIESTSQKSTKRPGFCNKKKKNIVATLICFVREIQRRVKIFKRVPQKSHCAICHEPQRKAPYYLNPTE